MQLEKRPSKPCFVGSETTTTDKPMENEFAEIKDTRDRDVERQIFATCLPWTEIATFRRTLLAYGSQFFQQISGINVITYHAAIIYSGLGMNDFLTRLLAALNGAEYFLTS